MSDGRPAPLKGAALALTALALALGTFMQVLDLTIANVSLPTIAGNLGVSTDSGTWIITSFAVSNGISVPLTGSDVFLAPHPEMFKMADKVPNIGKFGVNPFVKAGEFHAYVREAEKAFDEGLAKQKAAVEASK